jgi:hypothetical protein
MDRKVRWFHAVGAAVAVFCTATAAAVVVLALATAERHASGGMRLLGTGDYAANPRWVRRGATLYATDNFRGFSLQVHYVYAGEMRPDSAFVATTRRWVGGWVDYSHVVTPRTSGARPYADTYTVTVSYGLVLLCLLTCGLGPLAAGGVRVRLLGWLQACGSVLPLRRHRRRGFPVEETATNKGNE